mmetsp:Transcript_7876/g.22406  ORF Transcript_7876/g.22406 Transcript_7876/m.22406 type:complete len:253 (+) Transcript_7876:271-1029(+)
MVRKEACDLPPLSASPLSFTAVLSARSGSALTAPASASASVSEWLRVRWRLEDWPSWSRRRSFSPAPSPPPPPPPPLTPPCPSASLSESSLSSSSSAVMCSNLKSTKPSMAQAPSETRHSSELSHSATEKLYSEATLGSMAKLTALPTRAKERTMANAVARSAPRNHLAQKAFWHTESVSPPRPKTNRPASATTKAVLVPLHAGSLAATATMVQPSATRLQQISAPRRRPSTWSMIMPPKKGCTVLGRLYSE